MMHHMLCLPIITIQLVMLVNSFFSEETSARPHLALKKRLMKMVIRNCGPVVAKDKPWTLHILLLLFFSLLLDKEKKNMIKF